MEQQKNTVHTAHIKRHGILLTLLGVGMLGLAYGFVPLYRTFCQLVGIPVVTVGTTLTPQVPQAYAPTPEGEAAREVTVRFIGHANAGVPVAFMPRDRAIKVKVGEPVLTAYDAKNLSLQSLDGIASHTIVAQGGHTRDVAKHITLTQCFCFDKQTYPAQTEVTLPLSFTVEASLPAHIHTITFGYTLFRLAPEGPLP